MTRGPEAGLRPGRQQAGAERRLGRGDARERARRRLLATELDFDIGVTGFSIPEIDSLIEGLDAGGAGRPGRRPAARAADGPAVTPSGRPLASWASTG